MVEHPWGRNAERRASFVRGALAGAASRWVGEPSNREVVISFRGLDWGSGPYDILIRASPAEVE